MTYVRSIADVGAKYGIIKIVPPESWNPDFAIDTEVRGLGGMTPQCIPLITLTLMS